MWLSPCHVTWSMSCDLVMSCDLKHVTWLCHVTYRLIEEEDSHSTDDRNNINKRLHDNPHCPMQLSQNNTQTINRSVTARAPQSWGKLNLSGFRQLSCSPKKSGFFKDWNNRLLNGRELIFLRGDQTEETTTTKIERSSTWNETKTLFLKHTFASFACVFDFFCLVTKILFSLVLLFQRQTHDKREEISLKTVSNYILTPSSFALSFMPYLWWLAFMFYMLFWPQF